MKFDIWFILLCISLIFISGLGVYILKMRNKKQIHYAFLGVIASIFMWSFGIFLFALNKFSDMFYVYLYFLGVCFVPISVTFLGLIFAYTNIDFNWRYKLLFIFPIIDYLIVITNQYHNLFFIRYSHINSLIKYGEFYFTHTIILYLYIFVGLGYLLYYSIKNSGFFSKQSLLIIFGVSVPFGFNILENFKVLTLSIYITPVAFSFAVMCWSLAIFKFDFLNIVPIAMQKVVDLISDGVIVIDEDFKIIDYNKTLVDMLAGAVSFDRKDNIVDVVDTAKLFDISRADFKSIIIKAIEKRKSFSIEQHSKKEDFDKYFTIEITPIHNGDKHIGTIILLKDITEVKNNISLIEQQHNQLVQSERLASLGQLVGGIAHNLKTPIMSIAGGVEGLKDLISEYKESIGDSEVTNDDHNEIASEMLSWAEKIQTHCSYMSDIITAVKGQAVQLNASSDSTFTLDELVKRVDILMKHELKKHYCTIHEDIQVNTETTLKGEINNLVQILDNLIVNAIHSYEEKGGDINLSIKQEGNNIEFIIQDFGKGIPKEVQDRLFREMVTTKGKNGTGLGLYMSYSTIKGKFGGNMWFESVEGQGTTFYITIPFVNNIPNKEVS